MGSLPYEKIIQVHSNLVGAQVLQMLTIQTIMASGLTLHLLVILFRSFRSTALLYLASSVHETEFGLSIPTQR